MMPRVHSYAGCPVAEHWRGRTDEQVLERSLGELACENPLIHYYVEHWLDGTAMPPEARTQAELLGVLVYKLLKQQIEADALLRETEWGL